MGLAARVSLRHEVLCADGQDDPVHRTPFSVFLEQLEELGPAGAVGVGVGILCRVTASRVEEHRFVGEPPITIARAPDTAERSLAGSLLERKMQSRVDEGRRLSRAGGADDHVPRQVVETVTGAALLLEDSDRFFEALAELYGVGARSCLGSRLLDDGRNQLVAGGIGAHPFDQLYAYPEENDDPDRHQSSGDGFERTPVGKRKQRSCEPDEEGQQDESQDDQEDSALEKSKHGRHAPRTWIISTLRLRARFSGVDSGL